VPQCAAAATLTLDLPAKLQMPICAKVTIGPSRTVMRRFSDESAMGALPVQALERCSTAW
jgi:hypothetical protein